MQVVTTSFITGKNLSTIGIVQGSTVHSKNLGKDLTAGIKTLVGGELKAYSEMLAEARAIALNRMIEQAATLGADAVVDVRFSSAAIMQGAAEVLAYGTAVKFEE